MDNIIGIAYPEWKELRREIHDEIDPNRRSRARRLTFNSLITMWRARGERKKFGAEVAKVKPPAPLFVIGHWRSGTTLLQSLLGQDEQFIYPRIYQVSNPHTFLLLPPDEVLATRFKEIVRKRPMDNVEFNPLSPGEDEFATCPMSIRSHMIAWSFPRQEPFYDRFLTFWDAEAEERERWTAAFRLFLKKLAYRYNTGRPLLKSPQHTARIAMLLEEFPEARFVHIQRDPYVVYRSTEKLYRSGILPAALQAAPHPKFVEDGIIRRYREMYDAYFVESSQIPGGQHCEVKFEDLEADKLGTVARVYEALRLPGYANVEPRLKSYIAGLEGYQKNTYTDIEETLRRRIATEWRRSFETWGYAA